MSQNTIASNKTISPVSNSLLGPLVCICIPTYNVEKTIAASLQSILAQTYPNLVIFVSDNASSDDTVKVVEKMADPRMTICCQEVNIGAEGNFTKCIQLATGKYTAIFHADDIYEPDMIAKQVAYLEGHPDVGAVFTEALTIDESDMVTGLIGTVLGDTRKVRQYAFAEIIKILLRQYNFLVCPSAMVRTDIYRNEIKQWRGDIFHSSADGDTWLRIARAHSLAVLSQPLMRYRISDSQFSNTIRARTARADFFLLMDYYLAQSEVRQFLTASDLRHYRWLDRHDQVVRAINLFLNKQVLEAKLLVVDIFSWDAVYAAIITKRGLVTFFAGAVLRFMLLLRMENLGRSVFRMMKKISWK